MDQFDQAHPYTDRDENLPAQEDRQLQVYVDDEDTLVRVLKIAEGNYDCVRVNSSWPEKGLLEGDVVFLAESADAAAGDIVLIEEEGRIGLGLLSSPGVLETINGYRRLRPPERIVAVGVALSRKLKTPASTP